MDIDGFSPHIFWSYDRSAEIKPEVVIRQVIAYGEVKDMILLVKKVGEQKIHDVTGKWKDKEQISAFFSKELIKIKEQI